VKKEPLVSVIIPVFNGEKYIAQAVDSVLKQTYQDFEILLIDDGSVDKSLEIMNAYVDERVSVFQHLNGQNRGVSQTRKLGLENAKGKYVAFLDADDWFCPDKLEKQVAILENNPQHVLCHSSVNYITENKLSFPHDFNFSKVDKEYDFLDLPDFLTVNPVFNSSVLIRKEVLIEINFSMPQLFQFEDWITWILCSKKGSFYYLAESLCNYRYHEDSSTFKFHQNKLKAHYSWMEFYLCLLGVVSDKMILTKIYDDMHNRLKMLSIEYNNSDLSGINIDVFLHKNNSVELIQLRERVLQLENVLSRSKIFRILNYLNSQKLRLIRLVKNSN